LPITTEGMLYPDLAGVTAEDLEDAHATILSLSDDELLARSDIWQERIRKARNPDDVAAINTDFGNLATAALVYISEKMTLASMDGLFKKYNGENTEETYALEEIARLKAIIAGLPEESQTDPREVMGVIQKMKDEAISRLGACAAPKHT